LSVGVTRTDYNSRLLDLGLRRNARDKFFFFQAEDGIRDLTVTGVQTCALPISSLTTTPSPSTNCNTTNNGVINVAVGGGGTNYRSEERRVGKECRSRWLRMH